MTPPDRDKLNATPAYVRQLMERIGRPQVWISNRVGIAHRRLQYLVTGQRTQGGKTESVLLTYPEQYTLECLAESMQDGEK